MILPTKHLREDEALLAVGATLLAGLSNEKTLSELWDNVKTAPNIGTFERFILGLDLLFILGLVRLVNNKIQRITL